MRDALQSKKFWAYLIAVLAVGFVFVAAAFWEIKDTIVAATDGVIMTLTSLYHASQSSVDRAQMNSPYAPDKWGNYAPIQPTGGAGSTSPALPPVVPPRTP